MILRVLLALLLVARCAAMDFVSASSEYIDMGVVSAHALTSAHSYSVAFRHDSGASEADLFTRSLTGTPLTNTWQLRTAVDASPDLRAIGNGGTAYQLSPGVTNTLDDAAHVATVSFSSASNAVMYLDGGTELTDGSVSASVSGSLSTRLASRPGTSGTLDGEIFNVVLHDAQLSIDEHVEEYTTGLPARIPVSWWRPDLNGPTGSTCSGTVYDEADTAADGTCTNTPTFGEIPEGRTLR